MSNFKNVFNKKAFIAFVTAGDPDLESTEIFIDKMIDAAWNMDMDRVLARQAGVLEQSRKVFGLHVASAIGDDPCCADGDFRMLGIRDELLMRAPTDEQR